MYSALFNNNNLIIFCFVRTTVLQSMKLGIDVNRHKEIIVKAISGLLLLLLKHFRLSHIYQVRCNGSSFDSDISVIFTPFASHLFVMICNMDTHMSHGQ